MAEGLARASAPPGWRVYSAGSRPTTLNPRAVEALSELGIDIADHQSKGLDQVPIGVADYVITLCAEEECPYAATRGQRMSWAMPDPAAPGDDETQRQAFRQARDAIKERLDGFWLEVAS
jgi:protein-tyrosine-phosphatase